jgi:hypothetical protein
MEKTRWEDPLKTRTYYIADVHPDIIEDVENELKRQNIKYVMYAIPFTTEGVSLHVYHKKDVPKAEAIVSKLYKEYVEEDNKIKERR